MTPDSHFFDFSFCIVLSPRHPKGRGAESYKRTGGRRINAPSFIHLRGCVRYRTTDETI